MTKREALEKTIEMWEWIADECIDRRRKVNKFEYFSHIGLDKNHQPVNQCFLCEFAKNKHPESSKCFYCPITKWAHRQITINGFIVSPTCLKDLYGDYIGVAPSKYELCSNFALGIANLAREELENMEEWT